MNQLLIDAQIAIEQSYSRKGIKAAVLEYMATIPEVEVYIQRGAVMLQAWCEEESAYESKAVRRAHISQMDLIELTRDVFVRVASLGAETTLNNLASQLAPLMGFDDTRDGIKAMAEVIAVLCGTDFYNLEKYHVNSSIYVRSNFRLNDELQAYVERACYLPPLITKPMKLKNNRSSGYLTVKGDSLLLGGSINHHNDPIALDVLNLMNRYRLCLNYEFLSTVDEEPTSDLNTVENSDNMTEIEIARAVANQKKNWERHIEQCTIFYQHILDHGNKMYVTNKPDKRGRIYACGHHITPQGASYKKAVVDLYDKQTIEIPDGFFGA